jgi:hypothetical protein
MKRSPSTITIVKSSANKALLIAVIMLSPFMLLAQSDEHSALEESENTLIKKAITEQRYFKYKYTSNGAVEYNPDFSTNLDYNKALGYKVNSLIMPKINEKQKLYNASLTAQALVTTNDQVPFWLRANKFGSIPLDGISGSLLGSFSKDYDTSRKRKLLDWGAGFEGRVNTGNKSELLLIQGFVKARVSIFEIKAGRSKDIVGLVVDSTLSSGSFSISGNALGIPKVQISIPEYYSIPIFGKLLSFKGNFAHGWLGTIPLGNTIRVNRKITEVETYFHQKSFYGRIGKPNWKLKVYGGFNHQAFWGNEKKYLGSTFKLSEFETYKYIVFGKAFGAKNIGSSKLGNHLGSIDLGFDYEFENVRLTAFRQNFYDVGALYYLANIKDGLNGIKLENKRKKENGFDWRKIVVELFWSKSQGGELDSKKTPSGDEDYYNSFNYNEGWSYQGIGLGNPFITAKPFAQSNLPTKRYQYFSNNRVIALHTGFEGQINNINFLTKLSYSKNYGTYATSPIGYSGGGGRRYIGPPPYFPEVLNQFSGYLEANMDLRKGLNLGAATALDAGKMLNNSFGLMVSLKKSF